MLQLHLKQDLQKPSLPLPSAPICTKPSIPSLVCARTHLFIQNCEYLFTSAWSPTSRSHSVCVRTCWGRGRASGAACGSADRPVLCTVSEGAWGPQLPVEFPKAEMDCAVLLKWHISGLGNF